VRAGVDAMQADTRETPQMVDLSIPVIWVEDNGAPRAGRLDVTPSGLRLDGGSRDSRRTIDLAFGEIASFRIGRQSAERIAGRQAVVLTLARGGSLSFVGFDRPGAVHELAEHLERGGVAA
jgi:hypothetical protein